MFFQLCLVTTLKARVTLSVVWHRHKEVHPPTVSRCDRSARLRSVMSKKLRSLFRGATSVQCVGLPVPPLSGTRTDKGNLFFLTKTPDSWLSGWNQLLRSYSNSYNYDWFKNRMHNAYLLDFSFQVSQLFLNLVKTKRYGITFSPE